MALVRKDSLTAGMACLMLPLLAMSGTAPAPVPAGAGNLSRTAAFSPSSCVLPDLPGARNSNARRIAFDTPASAHELSVNLQCVLSGSVRGGRWGIMAVSLTRGDTIIAIDAGSSMQPASTQKLFTAALALDQLGADHHFRTAVLRSGQVDSNGVLQGDLILRGGGDPAFSDRFADDSSVTPVNQLAARVRQSGIAAVTGRLLADPFAFDSTLVPDGWLNRYLHAPYAARVSALSLNENVASVVVAPAESENATIAVLDPPASTMSVQNSVRLIPGARGSSIALRRLDDLTFEARGWIGQRASALRLAVVVDNPASFTAGAFRAALGERGIRIGGETVVSAAPREAVFVTDLESPPLSRLVTAMNRESINHYAELIFRNAGRGVEELQEGSAQSGFSQLSDFLASKVGTDPGSVYAVDGSGLSVLNRVTPRALVQLLSFAHYAPWGDVFHASMPVAGQSATLRDRMRNTSADGNLHAKTGTTSNVVSLSGYVTAANGEVLAFAFIYNGPDGARARSAIDHLGMGLANFARR